MPLGNGHGVSGALRTLPRTLPPSSASWPSFESLVGLELLSTTSSPRRPKPGLGRTLVGVFLLSSYMSRTKSDMLMGF